MSDLTDEGLPGYCHIHCRTERALFHGSHINRMLALAGHPDGYLKADPSLWYTVRAHEMDPLVRLAEQRLKEKK